MTAEDQPAQASLVQQAIGNYIAQAAQGGTATVNVYQYAASRSIAAADVRAGEELLATLPRDRVPEAQALPAGSRMVLRPNPLFTGRGAELSGLAAWIVADGATVAVNGIGGVGKTQVAAEFVHRYGRYFAGGVQWLSLADPGNVPAEVASCGDALALRPDLRSLPLDQRVAEVLGAWQQPLPRLLVFDNCEDEDLLATWRPTTGGARVLLTSRRRDWDPALGVDVLQLDVLTGVESIELIRRFRPDLSADDQDLAGIADKLGGLPLALHMAGNYLRTFRHVNLGEPAQYRSLLTDRAMLAHPSMTGDTERFSPTGHERNVAGTFAIGLQQLAGDSNRVARQALIIMACMAPGEPVPRELVHRTLGDAGAGEAELAVGRLDDLGLLTQGMAGELRMHRLIATFVGAEVDDLETRIAADNALVEYGREQCDATNARALAAIERHIRFATERALPVRDRAAAGWANLAGTVLNILGDYVGANAYFRESLTIAEELLGPDNPEIGKAINDLGHSYALMLDEAAAVPYFERAIPLWERAGDLVNLVATLANLGQCMIRTEQDPEPVLLRALELCTKVLGADHPHTATTLHSLGRFHYTASRHAEAERHFLGAHKIRETRGLRVAEANTLTALGMLYIEMMRYTDARTALERALAIRRAELGLNHTRSRLTLRLLVNVLLTIGDPAATRYSDLLTDKNQDGDSADDWNTAGYLAWVTGDFRVALQWYDRALSSGRLPLSLLLNNIGMARLSLEDPVAAVDLFVQALADAKPGLLHARFRNNLGVALTAASRLEDADRELTAALDERRQLHGETHFDVATTIDNIGRLRLRRGDLIGAAECLHQAHEMRQNGGPPADTAKSMHHLGLLATAYGDRAEARKCFEAALEIRRKHLPHHPDTAATLVELGLLGEALEIYQLRLGPDHPRTTAVRESLLRNGSANEGTRT